MANPAVRPTVFVSYAREDAHWLDRLRAHLRPLERALAIDRWDDSRLAPGDDWHAEIQKRLALAKVAILLLSPDFFASDYVHASELPPLLDAARSRAQIVPLIVRPSRFMRSPLSKFTAHGDPMRPLCDLSLGEQDRLLDSLVQHIESLLVPPAEADAQARSELADEADASPAASEQAPSAPAAGRAMLHPDNRAASRSESTPCRFFVSPFYDRAALWRRYADVQVDLIGETAKGPVFLIPSGAAPPSARETSILLDDPAALELKQRTGRAFVAEHSNRELAGEKFALVTRGGETRTKVYCAAYDEALRRAFT